MQRMSEDRSGTAATARGGGDTTSYSIYVTRQNMPVPLQNPMRPEYTKASCRETALGVAQEHVQWAASTAA